MTEAQMLQWIANISYTELLRKWRFEPVGSPWFQGEVGKVYGETLVARRNADLEGHVRASKEIGWVG